MSDAEKVMLDAESIEKIKELGDIGSEIMRKLMIPLLVEVSNDESVPKEDQIIAKDLLSLAEKILILSEGVDSEEEREALELEVAEELARIKSAVEESKASKENGDEEVEISLENIFTEQLQK